jgi:hypothetical protein
MRATTILGASGDDNSRKAAGSGALPGPSGDDAPEAGGKATMVLSKRTSGGGAPQAQW